MTRMKVTQEGTDGAMSIGPGERLQRARDGDDEDGGARGGLVRPRKRPSLESTAGGDAPGSTASLKEFAQRVRQKVEELRETTCKAVAQALIADIRDGCTAEEAARVNDQNIHRRVYDILNVMAAIGMVEKRKKTIVWHGVLCEDHRDEVNTLVQERHRLEDEVAKKQREGEELQVMAQAYDEAIRAAKATPALADTLALPFLFVVSEGDVVQSVPAFPAAPAAPARDGSGDGAGDGEGEGEGEGDGDGDGDGDPRRALLTFTETFRIFSDADALRQMVASHGGCNAFGVDDVIDYEMHDTMEKCRAQPPPPPLPPAPGVPAPLGV